MSAGWAPTIQSVALVPLTRHTDDGGALTELARLTDGGIGLVGLHAAAGELQ